MIKIISQERIGQPRKGFVSFKLRFADETLSQEKIENLGKKLLEYESHISHLNEGSAYEYNIDANDKMTTVIVHYLLNKWPFEEQREIKLINDFADDVVEFYKTKIN